MDRLTYDPTWDSLTAHEVPGWFRDAKLGIFVTWGPFSVPGWAPVQMGEMTVDGLGPEWFTNNPYAEWYLNSLRIPGSPTQVHHREHHGDGAFEAFVDQWDTSAWDPGQWADLFERAGARYVVMLTKHHDGYNLWPTQLTDHSVGSRGPQRDLVGELTDAVRARGLQMGLYYSGGLDWRFTDEPILTFDDLERIVPGTEEYARYAHESVRELIHRYRPSVLWNDIGWPEEGRDELPALFAEYYNTVPDGLVNDRWSVDHRDVATHEYEMPDTPSGEVWEMIRGLGYSFGYNRNETEAETLDGPALIRLLVDVVSRNGNLLINVGPTAEGVIPDVQRTALEAMGEWLGRNGTAIHGTRPWVRAKDQHDGVDVHYTTNGDDLFVLLSAWPGTAIAVDVPPGTSGPTVAEVLGTDLRPPVEVGGDRLIVQLSGAAPVEQPVHVIRLTGCGAPQ